ncbi:probable DNA primase large subunit isoform X2 [Hevea brasiliensis]|uniref:probable DNA primase large subunit isoform X2 n=1 Tax=Hevea brasiliensis TaxID=3981 RepID=UPI0025FB2C95|nr:probable DNA primase large subunit isoform X2 [Hevea brasiliensis]
MYTHYTYLMPIYCLKFQFLKVSLMDCLAGKNLKKWKIWKWTSMIREQEKDCLTFIVEALCSSYPGPDYSQPKEFADLSIKDIDLVAKSSFPLCKSHLFEKLREDHHLKHGGRMQLGLFLKGVGLKLDDALAFWKAEFSQKVGAERFDKEYAYSIRHNYGREGERRL